jgi:protein TonB
MDNTMLENKAVTLEEIVFEKRNKEYGAYYLRKKYNKFVIISFIIAILGMSSAVAVPFIKAILNRERNVVLVKETSAELENVTNKEDIPPPPPPPPPPPEVQAQVKYTAPVVVDTVKQEVALATVDDLAESTTNEAVPDQVEVATDKDNVIQEEETVFFVVEESATFLGGDLNSFRDWIFKNTVYPQVAQENGIAGKVIVQFCVNHKGEVVDVKVIRGVDASLDEEAVRVIKSSPKWSPGKQGGKAVKQLFTMPVSFVLQ